jgi:hypothetical protein
VGLKAFRAIKVLLGRKDFRVTKDLQGLRET